MVIDVPGAEPETLPNMLGRAEEDIDHKIVSVP